MNFKKRDNGYLLVFDDILYIASYYHEHTVCRGGDITLPVILPSEDEQNTFKEWCHNNNVGEPALYTQLYESY